MLYEPNTIDWRVGAIVIHDADAKRYWMLMQVVKIQKNGLIQTKYLFPDGGKSIHKIWKNGKEHLLDPKRFGIILPDKVGETNAR